jgi:hypothetical protein
MLEPLTSDGRAVRLLSVGLCLLAGATLVLRSLQRWNEALALAWLVAWTDAFVLGFMLLISIRLATHSGARQRQFSIAFLLLVTAMIAVYLGIARALFGTMIEATAVPAGSAELLLWTAMAVVMGAVLTFPIVLMAADGLIRIACFLVRARNGRRSK